MPLFAVKTTRSFTKSRRNSTKMASQTSNPNTTMLPYRDELTGSIKYVPAAAPPSQQPLNYDSDAEPLVTPSFEEPASGLSEYDRQHFTATGRPAPKFKASGLANISGALYNVPQLLPRQYTDDSIIPAIITDVIPSAKPVEAKVEKKGLLSKLKGTKKEEEKGDKVLKVVYMPRREYQKYFARNNNGTYIGTEAHRRWTEEELEAEFAKYKPTPSKMKREGLLSGTGSGVGNTLGGVISAIN